MDTSEPAAAGRPIRAFVLLGGFGVVCRNLEYLEQLRERGLAVLLIAPEAWRKEALERMGDPAHPSSAIREAAFVSGSMSQEGSFTADVIATGMRWRERYDIAGVFAVGEVLVEQTGLLADALGVRSPGLRATRVCRSKYLQRWYLPEWSPLSMVVPAGRRDALDAAPGFPAVVKPAARHSSSGVAAVADRAALEQALTAYPDDENVLVEQRVTGPELSVESLVQDGAIRFASVTAKRTTERWSTRFVETAHSVPDPDRAVGDRLLEANRSVLHRLGFEDGVAHSEWRMTDRGPVLMEIAARTPGDGLMALYKLATGTAFEPQIMRAALGEPVEYPRPRRFARQVYLEHEPGVLEDVVVDWPGVAPVWVGEDGGWPDVEPGAAADPPALRAVLVLRDKGSELTELRDSDDRVVTFLIDAPSPEGLDRLESDVRGAIRLEIRSGPSR